MASDFGKIAIDVSKDKGYDLAKLGSMIREFETAVKGITDSSKVLSSNLKDLGESYRKEIYFPKGREKDIKNAFDALAKNRAGISDSSPISVSDVMDAPFDSQKVTIRSQRAVARARKLFLENSGYFEETTERDKYNVGVPSMESSVTSKRGATKSLFSAIMGDVRSIDREVTRKQDEQEAIKLAKKQEQIARQEAKKQERIEKQEARSKIQESKAIEKAKEKEEKDRENESKKNSISQLKMIGQLFAVYKAVKEVIEWITKLYALAVKGADKAFGNIVTGNQLGITPTAVARYGYIDIAKGLKEGTTTNAMGAIQAAFGDITNLDEEKLKKLAIVMGGGVSQMVQSGVGASDPEKFLKEIINIFVRRGLSGVNSLGQQVGQEQAIMNLSTYLGSIDTNIRDIFDRIIVDAMNPLNPQVNAYKKDAWGMFTGSGTPEIRKPNELEMASLKEARDTFNQYTAMFTQITDAFGRFVAISFEPMIEKLKSVLIRFLGTDAEKFQYQQEVKRKNISMSKSYDSYIAEKKGLLEGVNSKGVSKLERLNNYYINKKTGKINESTFRDANDMQKFLDFIGNEDITVADMMAYAQLLSAQAGKNIVAGLIANPNNYALATMSPLESMDTDVTQAFSKQLSGLKFKNVALQIGNEKIRYDITGAAYKNSSPLLRPAFDSYIDTMFREGSNSQDAKISAILESIMEGKGGGTITLIPTDKEITLEYQPADTKLDKQVVSVSLNTKNLASAAQ